MSSGRPKRVPDGAVKTFEQISALTGIPRSTAYRDCERFRDVLALEIVFAVLPRKIQRKWLEEKLASV